jgi:hypothetical protein
VCDIISNTFYFNAHIHNRIEKLKPFMSIIQNIETNQRDKPITIKSNQIKSNQKHHETMPAFIAEILSMAGAFTVLFSILFCCIKADREDSYTRQLRRLRNYKCRCSKCVKSGKSDKSVKSRSGSKTR